MFLKMLIFIVLMFGFTHSQTAGDIDMLMKCKFYYEPDPPYYECFPVILFPFFAADGPRPPLMDKYKGYTSEKNYNYYKFYDKDGIHFIFSSLSYNSKERFPLSKTFTLFFYTTKNGRWVQEIEPLTAVFDLVGDTYVPRL